MKTFHDYSLDELKLIYQVLHTQIIESPALMDSSLLTDLQSFLQRCATEDGVDVSTHSEWAAWLNGLFVKSS